MAAPNPTLKPFVAILREDSKIVAFEAGEEDGKEKWRHSWWRFRKKEQNTFVAISRRKKMPNHVIYCVILRQSVLLFLLLFLAVFPSRSPIGGEGNSIASATTSESDCLSVLVGSLGYLFFLLLLFLPPPPFSQGGK